ncbi:eIF3-p44 [Capsaspora owczarzaki ATCC 30864]|nr:eIF3-p44 [Capsaspora owczarzaki ATCC 30864]|eukprot:XP_004347918.1 eIF3-p44 [Capsaspora owczarzaki ATCC 30864]
MPESTATASSSAKWGDVLDEELEYAHDLPAPGSLSVSQSIGQQQQHQQQQQQPTIDAAYVSKYADDDEDELPGLQVVGPDANGVKLVIEHRRDDNTGAVVKVTRKFQLSKQKTTLSHAEAERRHWTKFGAETGAKPGPDPATTIVADEVFLVLTAKSHELGTDATSAPQDEKIKLATGAGGAVASKAVSCRICKGDHWTTHCPHKELAASQDDLEKEERAKSLREQVLDKDAAATGGAQPGKYVPPSMRGADGARRAPGADARGSSMRDRDDANTIRISNLSDDTRESDVGDLCSPFGRVQRTFLVRDKVTGASKGFAFVSFGSRDEAAKAIEKLHGHGYDHLILSVDWAK